jgi:hypothetical protein
MRLYPYPDPVPAVDAPEGHFEPAEDGGFDFPDSLFTRLHSTHHNGEKRWETAVEQRNRRHGEEHDRRRDPETLYNAVAEIANATKNLRQPAGVPDDVREELAALRAELAELRAASATPESAADSEAPGGGAGHAEDESDAGAEDAGTETDSGNAAPEPAPKTTRSRSKSGSA